MYEDKQTIVPYEVVFIYPYTLMTLEEIVEKRIDHVNTLLAMSQLKLEEHKDASKDYRLWEVDLEQIATELLVMWDFLWRKFRLFPNLMEECQN